MAVSRAHRLLCHRRQTLREQRFLAVEVVVEGRLGEVETVGDLFQARVVVPLLRQDLGRRPEDLLGPALALAATRPSDADFSKGRALIPSC